MFKNILVLVLVFLHSNVTCQDQINLISWNIRDFGKTKNSEELDQIANIVREADILAIQEVVAGYGGAPAVAKLSDILNRKGSKWDYVISEKTKSPKYATERYAFIWKTKRIKIKNRGRLIGELDSLVDREPFQLNFYVEGRQLSLVNFHSRPHDKNPKAEITAISDYLCNVNDGVPMILAGDFNVDGNDAIFDQLIKASFQQAVMDAKTTLKRECNRNSYLNYAIDNIFYSKEISKAESGTLDFVRFCENLEKARRLSDHLPVFLEFSLN